MAETWPATLQQKLNQQGFSFAKGETSLTSGVSGGEPKKRRRFTKAIDIYQGSFDLEFSEFDTLNTFYDTTLAGGTLTFLFEEPFSQANAEFQFVSPFTIAPLGGGNFRVSVQWRKV